MMDILFKNILMNTQKELLSRLPKILKQFKYNNIINTRNYIYAEGDIPVLLVAHLDTVHYSRVKNIFHDKEQNVIWSPEGIGGDDRCGVFAILKIIEQFNPHVLFTTDEENGGVGAKKVIKKLIKPDVNFIIELDRQGLNDAVFYECGNIDFIDYILDFGFKEEYGTFSDISILSPYWDIASVNLSIGYYNEHTKGEYIRLNEMYNTIEKVKNILIQKNERYYDYQELIINKNVYNKFIDEDEEFKLFCDELQGLECGNIKGFKIRNTH